ncbi:site-specific integrase [Escherichia coli]
MERQLSPITLLNYQRQLEAIINFASENGLQSWQQCDAAMVRNFAVRSRRKGLGAASLAYGFLRYVAFLTGWSPERTQS